MEYGISYSKDEFVDMYLEKNDFLIPKTVVAGEILISEKYKEYENLKEQFPIVDVSKFLSEGLKNGRNIENFVEIRDNSLLTYEGAIKTSDYNNRASNDLIIDLFKDPVNGFYYCVVTVDLGNEEVSSQFIMKYNCDDESQLMEDLSKKVPTMHFEDVDGYSVSIDGSIMTDKLYITVKKDGILVAEYDGYINVIGEEENIINEIRDKIIIDLV